MTRTTADLDRLSARLLHLMSFVPEEKLTWAPSSTARSPLTIAAHCALVNRFFASIITDTMPETMPTPQEFFDGLREGAGKIASREEAVALLEETTVELTSAVSGVHAGTIEALRRSPFGPIPVQFWIEQGPGHLAGHIGQVEYLQTIWGDLDDHFN
ncbi:MAG: DinB family protein [Armatimonas sp.]